MNVILVIIDGNINVYGNFKIACEHHDELNYHRDKSKKFPIYIGADICVEKHYVLRGGRKNNKITPTELN